MGRKERVQRWRAMMASVQDQDVVWWRETFTDALMREPQVA
jgi:trehalose 6-phosphate synthase